MTTDRVFVVGIVWAVVLLVLLVLREIARSTGRPSSKAMLPTLNRLVVVMIGAFALTSILRLAELTRPTDTRASPLSTPVLTAPPTAGAQGSAGVQGSAAASIPSLPAPAAEPSGALPPTTPSLAPTPRPTAVPRPTFSPTAPPSPSPSPTPSPSPSPSPSASPTASPSPTPNPTPSPAPSPTPAAAPTATPAFGTVSVGRAFTSYEVSGGRVTGYHVVSVESAFTARATAPATYALATFSDPAGTTELVRIVSGPYAGVWVSPDDAGVHYEPGG